MALRLDLEGFGWLIIVCLIALFGTAGFRLAIPAVAYYARAVLRLPMSFISLLTIIFIISRASAASLSGALTDKGVIGSLAPLLPILSSILLLLYGVMRTWISFLILRLMQGVVNGFFWIYLQVFIASRAPRRWRGTALAIYFAFGSMGIFLGNALYAFLAALEDIYVFSASSILSAVTIPLTYLILGNVGEEPVRGYEGEMELKAELVKVHPLLLVSFLMAFIGGLVVGDPIYIYLNEFLDLSREFSAILMGLTGILGLIVSIPMNMIADRLSESKAVALSITFTSLTPILLALRNKGVVLVGLITAAVGWKSFTPLSRRYAASHFGRIGMRIGLVNASMNLGTMAGLMLFSKIYDLSQALTLRILGLTIHPAPLTLSAAIPLLIILTKSLLRECE